ncbi:TonB-dependent receptor [Pedobacter nyackensis]|uniref:SusC/RagA family TonB-linked outer membrane protein n=1 Tax=Pedobacter nyackensis TaxID=475255 RepID=UPI00292DC832|nr:TonB-dependent receptor [Pedobacter nyackensis]
MKLKNLLFSRASISMLALLSGSFASEATELLRPVFVKSRANDNEKNVDPKTVHLNETLDLLLTHTHSTAFAIIKGKVVDNKGIGLPGISIKVDRTGASAQTDQNGNFQIEANSGDIISFSAIGYTSKKLTVSNEKTVLTITLEEDDKDLEEIVVVGYGTQKKVNLTGAISTIKTTDITSIPVSNLSNALAGRLPGATIVGSSGLAGAASSIRVRGSSVEPLYVINGIIKTKADFDALNANEVESISILKDAATASIYGSKGGDGVVLVTTKKGIVQKPTFDYSNSFSFSKTTQPQQDFTATEELRYNNNVARGKGVPEPIGQELFDYFKDKSYSINDYIWRNPSVQEHNIGLRGGSEIIQYNMNLAYHDENGSYNNLDFNRYNFRGDITAKVSERIKINLNLSGNQRNFNRWYWPYDDPASNTVGDFYRATFNWTRLYPFYVDAVGNPSTNTSDLPVIAGSWSPVWAVNNSPAYIHNKLRTLDGILKFDLDLGEYVPGLSTALQAQYNANDNNMKSFVVFNEVYKFQSNPNSPNNKYVPGPINPTQINIHTMSNNYPNIREGFGLGDGYTLNWFLNYNKTIGKHAINAMAVYEQARTNFKSLNGMRQKLLINDIDQLFNASDDAVNSTFSGRESIETRSSVIGRVNYSYADKYIAEFSFREDGNYRFAPGIRWGFFPSGSAAWRLGQEDFMKDIKWLSELKLRGSFGTSGNDLAGISSDAIAPFQWAQYFNKASGTVFGSSLADGLAPGTLPNPNVTWATSKMLNIGLDFGLFNNRLTGSVEYFTKETSDILIARLASTPNTLGAALPAVNYAERSWKGFEFSAGWSDTKGEIDYSVFANMGYSKDQWDVFDQPAAYTDGTYLNNWRSVIGQPNNRISGLESLGIIRTQAQLDALPSTYTQYGLKPKLGYILYKDIRGANFSEGPDGKVDDNDVTFLSDNAIPRINFGFGFRVAWKGISLSTLFQGVAAYDKIVSTGNTSSGGVFQTGDRPYFEIWSKDYWTPETPNAKYPMASDLFGDQNVGGGPSTFWIRNGGYIRLKNIDLGYELPAKWVKHIGLQKVRLFANGTNLFVISDFKEHDPEQERLDSYPLMKTYTAGLNVTF